MTFIEFIAILQPQVKIYRKPPNISPPFFSLLTISMYKAPPPPSPPKLYKPRAYLYSEVYGSDVNDSFKSLENEIYRLDYRLRFFGNFGKSHIS